ncbi:MAG: hypothetical protein JO006_01340 [Paucibacter sp.]|nr:hypothetical protein [Roseateles sp.]
MKTSRLLPLLGAVLLALIGLVWLQQSPGLWRAPLTAAEVGAYLRRIDAQVPLRPEEKVAILERVKAFGEADDGRPVYMLNVMRFFDQIRPMAGGPNFEGTPVQANALYEEAATKLLLKNGGYPIYAGNTAEPNLFSTDAPLDHWSRVLVVRYPSRRAFLELLADPAYGPIAPYKLMSLDLMLTPTEVEMVVPELRLVTIVLALLVFMAAGWWRAARRGTRA